MNNPSSSSSHNSWNDNDHDSLESYGSNDPHHHHKNTSHTNTDVEALVKKGIAREESRAVNRVRYIVLIVLVLAGITVSLLVYFLSIKSVWDQFNVQFAGQAGQIEMSFQRIASETLGAFASLRVAAMAEAMDKNDTWPMFTMSSFEKRAAVARRLSSCILIGIYPYIDNNETRQTYEAYTAQVGPVMM
jgi:hypothetical protein